MIKRYFKIKAFYQHMQVCVYGEMIDSFEIGTSVRQGCVLSHNIQQYSSDKLDDGYRLRSVQVYKSVQNNALMFHQ